MLDLPDPAYIECIGFVEINCRLSYLADWNAPQYRFPCNCSKTETCNQFVECLSTYSKIIKSGIACFKPKKNHTDVLEFNV